MMSEFDILTFFYLINDLDNNPSECAKFGEEMCKKAKLALMIHFRGGLAPPWIMMMSTSIRFCFVAFSLTL